MKRLSVIIFALMFTSFTFAAPAPKPKPLSPVAAAIKAGDDAWKVRGQPGMLDKSISSYEEAVKQDSESFEGNWKLARSMIWKADGSTDKDVQANIGEKCYEFGQKAIKLQPDKIEGYYYSANCLGQYSLGISIISALAKGIESKFLEPLKVALKMDPSYDDGGPERSYGLYFYNLPWPKKDNDKAIEHLSKALLFNPKLARTHLNLAEVYEDEDKKEEAKKHLEECLKTDVNAPGYGADNARNIEKCKTLLAKIS